MYNNNNKKKFTKKNLFLENSVGECASETKQHAKLMSYADTAATPELNHPHEWKCLDKEK